MDTLKEKIISMAQSLENDIIERRRDFHKHAETGWTEFRTASIIAERLHKLGYKVLIGSEVMDTSVMMGVPTPAELAKYKERALAQGGISRWIDKMDGGKTAVIGIMNFAGSGPTAAFRADMDANDVTESTSPNHRPYKEGFSSINPKAHHGCGHDGHSAMALAAAEILASLKGELKGTVKFIFQPAEEGLRGARPIAASGILDDVDYLLGMHLGGVNANRFGLLACQVKGWQASTKFDAEFTGVAAHSAGDTELGKNALLAAATALVGIHAIPRHSKGNSTVHIGTLNGGSGRNVIADYAALKGETRGETSDINAYMYKSAVNVIHSAAQMYGVTAKITECGYASGYKIDEDFVKFITPVAESLNLFEMLPCGLASGSEDYTILMERVQQHHGKSTFFRLGSDFAGPSHSANFDFNEKSLRLGTTVAAAALAATLTNPPKK